MRSDVALVPAAAASNRRDARLAAPRVLDAAAAARRAEGASASASERPQGAHQAAATRHRPARPSGVFRVGARNSADDSRAPRPDEQRQDARGAGGVARRALGRVRRSAAAACGGGARPAERRRRGVRAAHRPGAAARGGRVAPGVHGRDVLDGDAGRGRRPRRDPDARPPGARVGVDARAARAARRVRPRVRLGRRAAAAALARRRVWR